MRRSGMSQRELKVTLQTREATIIMTGNLTKRIERQHKRQGSSQADFAGISQRELKAEVASSTLIVYYEVWESHKENLMVRCFCVVILRRGVIAFKIF